MFKPVAGYVAYKHPGLILYQGTELDAAVVPGLWVKNFIILRKTKHFCLKGTRDRVFRGLYFDSEQEYVLAYQQNQQKSVERSAGIPTSPLIVRVTRPLLQSFPCLLLVPLMDSIYAQMGAANGFQECGKRANGCQPTASFEVTGMVPCAPQTAPINCRIFGWSSQRVGQTTRQDLKHTTL